jgi:hypothetical protein
MIKKKDLVTQEEIDMCLRYAARSKDNSNESLQERLLTVLHKTEISLDEPIFEDSIDSTRIRFICTITISRTKKADDEGPIRFQYIRETSIDYNKFPIRLRDSSSSITDPASSYLGDTGSYNNNNKNSTIGEDTVIESYDELENMTPTLYEILGHLKKVYFMPEDFSNRLVIDRIHKLRNMFSKDEILNFPSIALSDRAGLIPL